ncbi:hypothetical protein [Ensifer adhaerens]|uniref:hypothetical protein n=1 Tax=Ensifer adhaerens TaxID=106592 RepID=UPI003CFC192A
MIIDAVKCLANGGIGFSKREESVIAQTSQNAGLGETDTVLDFDLSFGRLGRAGRTPTP